MFEATTELGEGVYDVGEAMDSGQMDVVSLAIATIDRGDTLQGLIMLEGLPALRTTTVSRSYLAYCMARERGQIQRALSICRASLSADPHPAHYLNLGRVLLLAGDKEKAIASFWRGISRNSGPAGTTAADWPRSGQRREHDMIMDELRRLGIRKPPPFPSLRRGHPLNKYTGMVLTRFGMR